MTFLKMLVTVLGQVLTWCAGHRARQFVETQFRLAGYDEQRIDAAKDAVSLLVAALITTLMSQILHILDRL